MSVSQLARSIKASPTLKLNETAAKLREKGEPVIHLGGGEPKSKAPLDAILNCATQLNTGEVRYAPADGLPALKKSILRYTEENYGRLLAPANVIVSSGAKQSIMNILYAILEPKDEVVFPAPYWVSYPEMVKLAGGVAGAGRARGRQLPALGARHRRQGGLVHEGGDPQQPEQPVGGHVPGGLHRGDRRVLREEEPLADHGRPVQPARLRRPEGPEPVRVREGAPARPRGSSWSRASRRCTR